MYGFDLPFFTPEMSDLYEEQGLEIDMRKMVNAGTIRHVSDGMNGKYTRVGLVLAESEMNDSYIEGIVGSPVFPYEADRNFVGFPVEDDTLHNRLCEAFGNYWIGESLSYMVFTHYV